MPKLTSVKVSLQLPYLAGIEGTWQPDESEQNAAWELYVELVTRISVVELQSNEGVLREALTSLYTLFDTTRKIMRTYGPSIARPKGESDFSFGYLAVAILNGLLRPVLAKWHPALLSYEDKRSATTFPGEYEQQWEGNEQLRHDLNHVRGILIECSMLFAQVAGVPSLIPQEDETENNS